MDYIDKLQQSIHNIIQLEYAINGYKTQVEAQTQSGCKQEETNYDLIKLNNQLNKMAMKKEFRKKISTDSSVIEAKDEQISKMAINDDSYNKIDDDKQYDEWRQIDHETKLKILEAYFDEQRDNNGTAISDAIRKEIVSAIEDNKILYKKDINYDKINRKIVSINGLMYVDGNYRFAMVQTKAKKKNLVNTILKK